MVYTLAGVDCIDCAADAAVVSAVNEGIDAAMEVVELRRPWVMISVNDDDDLHFRKAEFDPDDCPMDCSRPCELVCPANAIKLDDHSGVITERCYGCGRCFPVCPYDKIREVTYIRDSATTSELLRRSDISLPYTGESAMSVMNEMHSIMEPHLKCLNLWQLDGRPMSGDIGRGATRESIAFAVRLAVAKDRPLGFLQLAGGTNAHTADGLRKEGLFQTTLENSNDVRSVLASPSSAFIGGVAYGGYARKIVGRVLSSMPSQQGPSSIEDHPELLVEALGLALGLVGTVKCYHPVHHSSFR
ncbi:unnamed protein product [Linum tenue]|uniref:4Fe-4S ferredoxin-type domain-containing protein n=1 Tax=Linum tenue TaxID=586396 RepID=A0AAV0S401_9ROSI|nr:unnamed protein product [Linum tenue]